MTRAERVHRIAEVTHLSEHEVAAVLEVDAQLLGDEDDRGHAASLPRTGGVYDGWAVGSRGEAAGGASCSAA